MFLKTILIILCNYKSIKKNFLNVRNGTLMNALYPGVTEESFLMKI